MGGLDPSTTAFTLEWDGVHLCKALGRPGSRFGGGVPDPRDLSPMVARQLSPLRCRAAPASNRRQTSSLEEGFESDIDESEQGTNPPNARETTFDGPYLMGFRAANRLLASAVWKPTSTRKSIRQLLPGASTAVALSDAFPAVFRLGARGKATMKPAAPILGDGRQSAVVA